MKEIRAQEVETVTLHCGVTLRLHSLRQPVKPPFLLVMPFIELPPFIELLGQDALEEEGVHGCSYLLRASQAGTGVIHTGFRDLREGTIVLEKDISVESVD